MELNIKCKVVIYCEVILLEALEIKEAYISLRWPLHKLKAKHEEGFGFLLCFLSWGQ